jgi:hypothetical protein
VVRRWVVRSAQGTSGSGRNTPFSSNRLAFDTPAGGRALRPAREPGSSMGSTRGDDLLAGLGRGCVSGQGGEGFLGRRDARPGQRDEGGRDGDEHAQLEASGGR